ncbi:hypothetical protein GCM10027615_57420 [Plantactinospora veratri]
MVKTTIPTIHGARKPYATRVSRRRGPDRVVAVGLPVRSLIGAPFGGDSSRVEPRCLPVLPVTPTMPAGPQIRAE